MSDNSHIAKFDLQLISVTPFAQNCSLLWDTVSMDGIVVDPGGEPDKIIAAADQLGVTIKEIWLTHGHLDHAGGAQDIRDKLNITVIGPHKDDQFWMDDIEKHWANYGHKNMGKNIVPDRYLNDGDVLTLSGIKFYVTHTPGHTPGHVVIYNQDLKIAFVGDVLFRGSIGRTDFPKSNHQDLIDSICNKLWPLGHDMRFVPGHGPMSTFGAERADNPFVGDDVIQSENGTTAPNNSGVM